MKTSDSSHHQLVLIKGLEPQSDSPFSSLTLIQRLHACSRVSPLVALDQQLT